MSRILLLFDIDGTLIARGDPAHLDALDAGCRAVLPAADCVPVRAIDFDGKVDRQILGELLVLAAAQPTPLLLDRAVVATSAAYQRAWAGRTGADDLLPGVGPLLAWLGHDRRFALGVLTGGLRGVVEVKLRRLGLSDRFPIGAYGDEVEQRADLLPLALTRAKRHYGEAFPPGAVVVIGDTPNDVACARSGGVVCLGVATGRFSRDELLAAGADWVLPDLADRCLVIGAIESLTGRASGC